MTGHLETRIGDLEKVTETVEVKLSRLRRGTGATSSCSSSSSTSTAAGTGKRRHHHHRHSDRFRMGSGGSSSCREGLLYNRCAQLILFFLVGLTLLSLTSMALVFIAGYLSSSGEANNISPDIELDFVSLDNNDDDKQSRLNTTRVDERQNEVTFDWPKTPSSSLTPSLPTTVKIKSTTGFIRPLPSTTTTTTTTRRTTTRITTTTSTTTTTTTTTTTLQAVLPPPVPPPVIGERQECLLNSHRCQVYCCGQFSPPAVASVNETADDARTLDNNLTAPGEDLVTASNDDLDFHPDVLFVQDPFLKPPAEDDKEDKALAKDHVVKLVKAAADRAEKDLEHITPSTDEQDFILPEKDNAENEEEVEPEEDKSNQVLDDEEENEDISPSQKAIEEERKAGPYANGGRVVLRIKQVLPKPEEKVTLREDASIRTSTDRVATTTSDKDNFELTSSRTSLNELDNEEGDGDSKREVRLLKPEPGASHLNQLTADKDSSNLEEPSPKANRTISMISDDDKELNEVLDDEDDGDNIGQEDTTENVVIERAKREIRDLFSRMLMSLVRKTRNVDETEDFDSANRASDTSSSSTDNNNNNIFPTLYAASVGNVTLDSRFCDQNAANFDDCRRGTAFGNVSLSVPLSQHFGDSNVQVEFDSADQSDNTILCPITATHSIENDCFSDTPALQQQQEDLSLDVSSKKLSAYKLRQLLVTDEDDQLSQLCQLPDGDAGTVFREYNIVFYRVCHL